MKIQQIISRESEETMMEFREILPEMPSPLTDDEMFDDGRTDFSARSYNEKRVDKDKERRKFFYPVLRTGSSLPSPYFFRRNLLINDSLATEETLLPWEIVKNPGIK